MGVLVSVCVFVCGRLFRCGWVGGPHPLHTHTQTKKNTNTKPPRPTHPLIPHPPTSPYHCRYANTNRAGRKIYVEKEDFRAKKMARKAGGLIVFIVDASGASVQIQSVWLCPNEKA